MQAFFSSFANAEAAAVPLYAPSREKGTPERPQTLRCTEIINHFSAENAQQRRRPPPVAETGRSCWGSGQQDARAVQGTMRMLGAATRKTRRAFKISPRSKKAAAQKVQRLCGTSHHSQRSAMIHHIPGRLIRPSRCSNTISMVFSFQTVRFQPNSPFSKNRSSLVKLPPPKRLSSGPRP